MEDRITNIEKSAKVTQDQNPNSIKPDWYRPRNSICCITSDHFVSTIFI